MFGKASITGSNSPRTRPALIIASFSSSALRANRAVSSRSRPIVLITRAPSNDSCATPLTSARSCWARDSSGETFCP